MRLFPGILIVLTALPAFPQAMVEHAAAASGASIGAAGGKVVSNGITAIFGKVDETTAHAAGKPSEKESPKEVKPTALGGAAGDTGVTAGPVESHGAATSRAHHANSARSARTSQLPPQAEPIVPVRVAPAPVKEPALQDLLGVLPGSKEQDFIAVLGPPSSRISIPEEGHMTELLRYSIQGHLLGTIRLDNGQVVNVQAVNVSH